MNCTFTKRCKLLLIAVLFSLSLSSISIAQERVKKVVFQAFWWDYWNENYRFGWANYLAELAPRLKAAGFNAVWIPPAYKNDDPGSVGYMPFDNYDLGDKRQKGNGHPLNDRMRTRVGTKDDLLRLFAIMKANGIEVIHDVVLNHNGGAGGGVLTHGAPGAAGTAGAGGQDPAPNSSNTAAGFKNFRYVSYATPSIDETANDYWTRAGRWAKNAANFYNCNSGCNDITSTFWGPDMNYEASGVGVSSNIPTSGNILVGGNTVRNYVNPTQGANYMLNNARDWLVWLKKQTGAGGFRWDAVKHFPYGGGSVPGVNVQENIIYAAKYNAGFASGGQDMLNIGEWVGSTNDLDGYLNNIRTGSAPGGVTNEINTGTFDFNLRGFNGGDNAIFSLVTGNGNYNMASLPGRQQNIRFMDYPGGKRVHRTVPFINNHDTYRPILANNGNFSQPLGNSSGWNTGSQLATNIDPREPRLAAAYAVIFAVDGNPQVFFEDLFNNWGLGKRYTHLPTSTTDLPANADIVNIMQAHQALGFKDGDYGVPTASNSPFYSTGNSTDHIVFERVGKALIGITDVFNSTNDNTSDQEVFCKVNDAWPIGTVLYDYSGAHGIQTVTIPADRRVLVKTAPVGHTISGANGHGYSIWAPAPVNVTINAVSDLYNVLASYQQPLATSITQEWEMADDLGDSHCESLGQGGALPANSTNQRVVGKIFVEAGKSITYQVIPEINNSNVVCWLSNLDGTRLHTISGTASVSTPLSGSFTPTTTGWVVAKIRQGNTTQASQKAWVNITYTAPAVVDTRATTNSVATRVAVWSGNKQSNNVNDCGNWEEGALPSASRNLLISNNASIAPNFATSLEVKDLIVEQGAVLTIPFGVTLTVNGNAAIDGFVVGQGNVVIKGTAATNVQGTYSNLTINTSGTVNLTGSLAVSNLLTLTKGIINTGNNSILMSSNGSIFGGADTSFIRLSGTGSVVHWIVNAPVTFPIGNSNYTPISIANNGGSGNTTVSSSEMVFTNGATGSALATNQRLNKAWRIVGDVNTNLQVTNLTWNTADEASGFSRSNAFIAQSTNGNLYAPITGVVAVNGSNPFNISVPTNITNNSFVTVLSDNVILPVSLTSFTAANNNGAVQLNWNTANEVNNKGFYVQKSVDGTNFTSIGFVAGKGVPSNYNFTDANITAAMQYYRLQQQDNNGAISYSNVVSIAANAVSVNTLVKINANPITTIFALTPVSLQANAKLEVVVLNNNGKQLMATNGTLSTINQQLNNLFTKQAAGTYMLQLLSGNEKQILTIIKQ